VTARPGCPPAGSVLHPRVPAVRHVRRSRPADASTQR
jgi:hypothetical protein